MPCYITNLRILADQRVWRFQFPFSWLFSQAYKVCFFYAGRATFTTCGITQPCREDVDLVVGRSILFDTRLSYLDAGNSNMRQVTTELYLYKGDQCGSHGTRYAVCSNATGTTCVATTAFQDRLSFSIGSHLFDLSKYSYPYPYPLICHMSSSSKWLR